MVDFLGRTHILILHLPIGILLMATILEWVYIFKKVEIPKSIFTFIYFIGAVSAIFACISGNILSQGYEYTDEETFNHFWAGIVTASIATLAFLINFTSYSHYRKWMALAIAASITITGHLGGSLTHGEGFLKPSLVASSEPEPLEFHVDNIEDAEVYTEIISPLLENKCVSCHGPNKIKGKLRMDTPENLLENGKSGKELLAQNGELIRRIELPMSNDKHMPPDTKSQLTEEQLKVIKWWVENGASFDSKVIEVEQHEEILPLISKMIEESASPVDERKNIPAFLPEAEVAAPDEAAIIALQKSKVVVLPAGEGSNFLELNFVNVDSFTEDLIPHLNKLQGNITHLRLSGLPNAASAIPAIADMSNLIVLYLDDSETTDSSLKLLKNLSLLDFLNLSNNEEITDSGINELEGLSKLKTVYAFNTNVSLDSLNSGTQIVTGGFTLESLPTDTIRI